MVFSLAHRVRGCKARITRRLRQQIGVDCQSMPTSHAAVRHGVNPVAEIEVGHRPFGPHETCCAFWPFNRRTQIGEDRFFQAVDDARVRGAFRVALLQPLSWP